MDIQILSIALITCLAVISPGPDFAMTLRNSVRYGRGAGVMTAVGIASGISVHVAYTVWGLGYILTQNVWLMEVMKIAGAGYLVWIGLSSLRAREGLGNRDQAVDEPVSYGRGAAFKNGFLCNALNPKTALFFIALFTQVISPNTALSTQLILGAFIAGAHLVWFTAVAVLLTHNRLEKMMVKSKKWIEKITGVCLMGLGLKLLFHGT